VRRPGWVARVRGSAWATDVLPTVAGQAGCGRTEGRASESAGRSHVRHSRPEGRGGSPRATAGNCLTPLFEMTVNQIKFVLVEWKHRASRRTSDYAGGIEGVGRTRAMFACNHLSQVPMLPRVYNTSFIPDGELQIRCDSSERRQVSLDEVRKQRAQHRLPLHRGDRRRFGFALRHRRSTGRSGTRGGLTRATARFPPRTLSRRGRGPGR